LYLIDSIGVLSYLFEVNIYYFRSFSKFSEQIIDFIFKINLFFVTALLKFSQVICKIDFQMTD